MKKILLLGLFALLLIPFVSSATSGACSGHGGVMCSAGMDIDGSIQCNDGWKDSSVPFYDVKQCRDTQHACTDKEYTQIEAGLNLPKLRKQISDLKAEYAWKQAEYKKYSYSSSRLSTAQVADGQELASLATQLQAMQMNLDYTQNTLDIQCYQVGNARFEQEQYKRILLRLEEDKKAREQKPTLPEPVIEKPAVIEEKVIIQKPKIVPQKEIVQSPVVKEKIEVATPEKVEPPVQKVSAWKRFWSRLKFW